MSRLEPNPDAVSLTDEQLAILNGDTRDTSVYPQADLADANLADDQGAAPSVESTEPQDVEATTDGGQELQDGNVQGEQDGKQVESESSQATQADAWISQEILSYASTYGLNEDDLRAFGSHAELERVTRSLDKYAKKLFAPANTEQQPPSQGQQAAYLPPQEPGPQGSQAAAAPVQDRPGFKNGQIDLDYFKENYESDDPVLAVVEHANLVQQRLGDVANENQAIIDYLTKQEQTNQANAFHATVDAYNPEFFGKQFDDHGQPVTNMDVEYVKRRTEILSHAVNTIMPMVNRQIQLGQIDRMPTYPEVIHRAARAVYGADLDRLESKKRAEALKAQSLKKRPVANGSNGYRPRIVPERVTDPRTELLNDPELRDMWSAMKKEGVVA
jgi:hypothetical protein